MTFKLMYKCVSPYIKYISDVTQMFDGSKEAVKISQPISPDRFGYLHKELSDPELWDKSLNDPEYGHLYKLVDKGAIVPVYVDFKDLDDAGRPKELSVDEYEKQHGTGANSEMQAVAKVLSDRGITADKLAQLLDALSRPPVSAPQLPVPSSVEPPVAESSSSLVAPTVQKPKLSDVAVPSTYEEFSALKYQSKLSCVYRMSDVALLKEIVEKEKQTLVVRNASKKLESMTVSGA